MDLNYTDEAEAFRTEITGWLARTCRTGGSTRASR